ncbi:MAG: hypothetical protein ACC742_04005 [Thermoanaerobaculales bacterium]
MNLPDLDLIAPEAIPGIRVMPVLHERVDLAPVVRAVLTAVDPAVVAVELPTTLAEAAVKAVERLPKISVVISEEPGEDALVWVVTPGDPLVEGLRWAVEHDREVALVDPDIRYRHRRHDPLPDPHALHTLGADRYLELVRRIAGEAPFGDADTLRERGMAHHLRTTLDRVGAPIVCLVGAAHATRLARDLGNPTAPPLARQRRSRVHLRHLHPESLTAVLPDPPLAHAVFEHLRLGSPPPEPEIDATVSPRLEVPLAGLTLIAGPQADDRAARDRAVAAHAAHRAARAGPAGARVPDRSALGGVVWSVGAASYAEQTRTETTRWQRRLFFDFARRYALIQGRLVPGLYEWVVAARGMGDDNLAWEVFDVARCYPWQENVAEIETARVDGEMLDLGTRTVRFRRRFLRVKQRPMAVPVRRRTAPEDPGEWLRAFSGENICSYPPEDLVVEDWGRHLQHRAISILSSEQAHSEPFTTSMLDGIDLRETLLRRHEGRIWVRELGRAPGAAGSVVVIFDEDRESGDYPYLMSWLGEHEQESDMALYATDPTRQVVGPGIMRATYGGFMLSYPPGRLFDVWRDQDYARAASKPEVLLMAAVDYSLEKLVVQVAAHPPSSRVRDYAASRGRRIVHIPLGSLSPVSLGKVRVLHILAGRDKREIAKDYIW